MFFNSFTILYIEFKFKIVFLFISCFLFLIFTILYWNDYIILRKILIYKLIFFLKLYNHSTLYISNSYSLIENIYIYIYDLYNHDFSSFYINLNSFNLQSDFLNIKKKVILLNLLFFYYLFNMKYVMLLFIYLYYIISYLLVNNNKIKNIFFYLIICIWITAYFLINVFLFSAKLNFILFLILYNIVTLTYLYFQFSFNIYYNSKQFYLFVAFQILISIVMDIYIISFVILLMTHFLIYIYHIYSLCYRVVTN